MLRVRDLRVSFRTEHGLMKAIDGVSFDVSKGEILGVVGESGSGKTMSLLAVMGLIYNQYPKSSTTRLARLHFWLHNIGLPIFMGGLAMLLTGHPIPVALAVGATAFLIGLIVFAVNIWLTVGRQEHAG